jgi:hypothetical protein
VPVNAEIAIAAGAAIDADAIYSRIARRIIPVVILLFVMAWMERVRVASTRVGVATCAQIGIARPTTKAPATVVHS